MKPRISILAVLALAAGVAGVGIDGPDGVISGETHHVGRGAVVEVEQAGRRVQALCRIVDSSEREGMRPPA